MAEGVDAIAVDVGDGAVGAHVIVAGEKLDADHGAGLDVGGIAHGVGELAGGADGLAGFEPERAELRREGIEGGAGESAERERRGDVDHLGAAGHGERGLGKCAQELVGAKRDGRPRRGDGGARGDRADHVFDGTDAGDGLFGEGVPEGYGAHQFAVDVDGAAAHSLHDAGLRQRAAGEPAQDDGLVRPDIFQHAEDFHLKLFDAIPGEDRASDAVHAGPDVL
jgi:hypothetical protein